LPVLFRESILADLLVEAAARGPAAMGFARLGDLGVRCALGRNGITRDKVEGDGCTPAGSFPVRRLFYRPDRVRGFDCRLPMQPLARDDGWCDDPDDMAYNRLITRPYRGRHEELWREDALYDLVLVIGHNDDPVIPGKGSAVFLHLAQPDYAPTDGCIAFARVDFLALLQAMDPSTRIVIAPRGTGS
jgi:L,D-peptidoglycan transpeptidase YkuD (ErfK/YbiS/YcfS/YnhG family)